VWHALQTANHFLMRNRGYSVHPFVYLLLTLRLKSLHFCLSINRVCLRFFFIFVLFQVLFRRKLLSHLKRNTWFQ
jgi:hypothetical protein